MVALLEKAPLSYFFAYFIFFSALIVTIRSDLETMLISRFVTLFLIPLGFIASATNCLPISLMQSVVGAVGGYAILFGFAFFFFKITNKEGIGQGDVELLALIGSFTGFMGSWVSLFFWLIDRNMYYASLYAYNGSNSGEKNSFWSVFSSWRHCFCFVAPRNFTATVSIIYTSPS